MRNGHLLAEAPPEVVMKQHSATVSTAEAGYYLFDQQSKLYVRVNTQF